MMITHITTTYLPRGVPPYQTILVINCPLIWQKSQQLKHVARKQPNVHIFRCMWPDVKG